MGFEPTIPASERVKTVHALDRAATVIGHIFTNFLQILIVTKCDEKHGTQLNLHHPMF
jgi:hypothetical protein